MRKKFTLLLVMVLAFYSFSPILTQASELTMNGSGIDESVVEDTIQLTGIEGLNGNLEDYEEEFDFLVNDPVFQDMEEYLILSDQDVSIYEDGVQAQWVPIAAAAIRLLTSKVGKKGMQKGWALARPHVQKALDAPKNYILEGPGSGGRIVQVRSRKGGGVLFRLDYFPIKHGGPSYLHYHVPPNLKAHHIIKF